MGLVAVFGGTFNPIHIGHIQILKCLCDREDIDKVILIPTKIPPHKTSNYLAGEAQRLEMCRIAAKNFPKVVVSDIEVSREGKSYTVDTVLKLNELYPDSRIAITIGADMLVTLDQWKDYMTILKNSAVITFFRNDTMRSVYDNWIIRLQNLGADIIVIEESIPDVSSTEIREMLSAGDDVSAFLTDEIFDYIVSNGLYGDL